MNPFFSLGWFVLSILVTPASLWASQNAFGEFSYHLFKDFSQNHSSKNFVFSPYSLRSALGMAALGARGRTQRQLGKLPDSLGSKKEPSYKFLLANRLWVDMEFPLLGSFLDTNEKVFGVRPWMVDFSKAPDFLRDRVNGWVSERTMGKLKSILPENFISAGIRMLLTSAAYFKGVWAYPFSQADTEKNQFSTPDGKIIIPYLHKRGAFNYLQTQEAQILELPYLEGEISLVMILPDSSRDFSYFEESLHSDRVEQWLSEVSVKALNIYIPSFEIDSDFELKNALEGVGVTNPFSLETADFSGMTGKKDLYLSSLIHKAFIGVNDAGTEASSVGAAASSRNLASTLPSLDLSHETLFRADHPFVFMIRHRSSNSILFFGHVVHP